MSDSSHELYQSYSIFDRCDLEYKTHQYKSIIYKSAEVDSDYIDWNYNTPTSYSKLVVLNNYLHIYSLGEDERCIDISDPVFHVIKWEKLCQSPVFRNYFHTCLFFDDISLNLIIECIKDYIIFSCNEDSINFRDEITKFENSIKEISSQNIVDYDKPVIFDREMKNIRNI